MLSDSLYIGNYGLDSGFYIDYFVYEFLPQVFRLKNYYTIIPIFTFIINVLMPDGHLLFSLMKKVNKKIKKKSSQPLPTKPSSSRPFFRAPALYSFLI